MTADAPLIAVALASKGTPANLAACLEALEASAGLATEVVVARPRAAEDVSALIDARAWARLILVDGDPGIPVLRGTAMAAADSPWVVLTEDTFVPHPNWLDRLSARIAEGGRVIGGSVGNAQKSPLSHATYLTDYGSFPPNRPAASGVDALTGSNVAYGPEVRTRVSDWARDGAWEHVVHDRLIAEGVTLHFAPSVRVDHNATYQLRDILVERYHLAREYAEDRLREGDPPRKLARLLMAPIVPIVMTARLTNAARSGSLWHFIRAIPATLALYGAWVFGETVGFLKGPRSGQ